MLIDISPPISSALAVYPGDTPFRRVVQTSIEAGERAEVSTISSTSHLGAHIDAELHYQQGGRGVDQWPLERFVGPCLFNATNHGACSAKGCITSHGPFNNIHLDNAYANKAGWQRAWSLHYNKNVEDWRGWDIYDDLPDKARSSLHKTLHMGMGRSCGALLQAVVAVGA